MKDTEITEAINGGLEQVRSLIDRAVNQAVETSRGKMEADLNERVTAEIQRRDEEREQRARERTELSGELQEHFKGLGIEDDLDNWIDIDGLLSLSDEERTATIQSEVERITNLKDRLLKERFSGSAPMASQDTSEEAFKSQLLEKMR